MKYVYGFGRWLLMLAPRLVMVTFAAIVMLLAIPVFMLAKHNWEDFKTSYGKRLNFWVCDLARPILFMKSRYPMAVEMPEPRDPYTRPVKMPPRPPQGGSNIPRPSHLFVVKKE